MDLGALTDPIVFYTVATIVVIVAAAVLFSFIHLSAGLLAIRTWLQANFVAKAALLAVVATAMTARGSGRIGVLVPQNARLGLAGLGDLAAPQAALWTWAEALAGERDAAGAA